MTLLRGRTFWHSGGAVDISGATVKASEFSLCKLGVTHLDWSRLSDIRVDDVRTHECVVNRCLFEDISVHNLTSSGTWGLLIGACGFRHVRLSGRIEGIRMGWTDLEPHDLREETSRKIRDFYDGVDWALDISAARFSAQHALTMVPGDKIVRDTRTQALIKRETLDRLDWPSLDDAETPTEMTLALFHAQSPFDSMVLIAKSDDLQEIVALREEGVAEPD